MTKASSHQTPRKGRVFPSQQMSLEEKARIEALDEAFYKRCRIIFDRVQPELINSHYDWFIVIEPDRKDYIIEQDIDVARAKAREKYGNKMRMLMRLNETRTCGRI